jgi:phospholipase/lecithinase/hemolysin
MNLFMSERMKSIAKRWKIFAGFLFAFCLETNCGYSFTALYVFGDSLSDTGRSPAPAPSYYDGRFSNGPLWVEYLSAQLGLPYNPSNNFAVSGSTTSNLLSQIAGVPASAKLKSALCTILSGGNDFLDSVDMGVNDPGWNIVITNAVYNLANAINALYNNGAREILVGNLANIGTTPAFNGTPTGWPSYVDSKVAIFNANLSAAITTAMQQNSGLRIYLLNDNAGLSNVLSAPAAFGFTVATNGALEDPNLTDKSFNGPGANYVFWDMIHPTTKLNVRTAADAFAEVAVQMNLAHSGTNFILTTTNLYAGLAYTIQSSTNLAAWSTLKAFTATTNNLITTLTNPPAKQTYYRAIY